MAQVINTNIPSLNAQSNLNKTSAKFNQALQRLSSGLRINSAKDDAAGLAIATRMSSNIQGVTTAKRNANDAISLSQIAEGALHETTQILQRARELAVQSANGTNAANDRASLQSEVNQLKSELSRISTKTSFNGLNILDGSLAAAEFQIGPNQYETVTVSISDTRNLALGANDLEINNTESMLNANYAVTQELLGAHLGTLTATAAANSLITSVVGGTNDLLFTPTLNTGLAGTPVTVTTAASQPASLIAANINAVDSGNAAYATARTGARLSVLTLNNAGSTLTVRTKTVAGAWDGPSLSWAGNSAATYDDIATQINTSVPMQTAGIYAVSDLTGVNIYSTVGDDIGFEVVNANGSTNAATISTIDSSGAYANATAFAAANTTNSVNIVGTVTVATLQNYTMTESAAGNHLIEAMPTQYTTAHNNTAQKNRTVDQVITIAGSRGSVNHTITANDSAAIIKRAVNSLTGTTGVAAEAMTSLNIENISSAGTISFKIKGDNKITPMTINANVTTTDYSQLVKALNDISGATGITAKFDSGDNKKVTLTNKNGEDIEIYDFTHSASVSVPNPSSSAVTGTGSSVLALVTQTMDIVGNKADNTGGKTVKLYSGGNLGHLNSTVVGGKVTFTSDRSFSISSSVDGNTYQGSILSGAVNFGHGSVFSSIDVMDISTVDGAQSAIRVLDQALNQVSEIRAQLGAIQSRFESTIRNLSNSIENLSAAKSRIEDADFAAESAELAKTQMLTQAGLTILSQANAIPQNILTLLQ